MKRVYSQASEHLGFYLADPELAATLPVRPRLLAGLKAIPFGADGILFIGGQEAQVIKGAGVRVLLSALLPLLTGTTNAEELRTSVPRRLSDRVPEVIALLSHKGLVEEGSPPGETIGMIGDAPLEFYLERYVNVSRHYKSGHAVRQALARERVQIVAPHSIRDSLVSAFESLAVAELRFDRESSKCLSDVSFLLVIDTLEHSVQNVVEEAVRRSIPVFYARMDGSSVQVGPLFESRQSVSYRSMCSAREAHDAEGREIKGTVDPHDVDFWAGYIGHEFVNAISRTSPNPLFNRCRIFAPSAIGYFAVDVSLSPVAGESESILAATRPPPDPQSLFAWELHNRIRMPPKNLVGPGIYFGHYSLSNRSLTNRVKPKFFVPGIVTLPPAETVDLEVSARQTPLDVHTLSKLLYYSYGAQQTDTGLRVIAPSGGGLASPDGYVFVHQIATLQSGLYRYNADEHTLERLHEVHAEVLRAALGEPPANLRQCYVIGVAAFERLASKYGEMAFKHVNLDSGVIQTYLSLASERLKVPYAFLWRLDVRAVMDLAHIPYSEGRYFLTHVAALGNICRANREPHEMQQLFCSPLDARAKGPVMSPAARGAGILDPEQWPLLELLLDRRAVRAFRKEPVAATKLRELLQLAQGCLQGGQLESGTTLGLRLWLVLPYGSDEGLSGLYEVAPANAAMTLVAAFPSEDARLFSNQNSLAEASALVIITADLEQGLHAHGSAAYRVAFQIAGRALALLWLAVHATGMRGTISGGVIDDELHRLTKSNGYVDAALAMFAFGVPSLPSASNDEH